MILEYRAFKALKLMKHIKNIFPFLVLFILLFSASLVHAWPSQVVGVTDGDTIKVLHNHKQEKIRLYGVDTPEKKQAYGKAAKKFTSSLVSGKTVDVDTVKTDKYGRSVALV